VKAYVAIKYQCKEAGKAVKGAWHRAGAEKKTAQIRIGVISGENESVKRHHQKKIIKEIMAM